MIHREQIDILKNAKKKFPNLSLKDWSNKTGIQITRVFRLFHGSEMTLKEFYAFKESLQDCEHANRTQTALSEFSELNRECGQHLPTEIITDLNQKLRYHLENYYLIHGVQTLQKLGEK